MASSSTSAAPPSAHTSLARARNLVHPAAPLSRYLTAASDAVAARIALKISDHYSQELPASAGIPAPPASVSESTVATTTGDSGDTGDTGDDDDDDDSNLAMANLSSKRKRDAARVDSSKDSQLALVPGKKPHPFDSFSGGSSANVTTLTLKTKAGFEVPVPTYHAPWKLSSVISGHLGWVRSIAVDPLNQFVVTGSADRTIKLWSLPLLSTAAPNSLLLTLTGHINAVRGLAVSDRHPYMFSAGEDKMVKCWDLETNRVIRDYHGHLSGVFSLTLHPTLDILITGGRDSVARVWDMRTKNQIHCLSGHEGAIGAIQTNSVDPQVITGSYDSTVKLWDLAAGKCMTTLTHHKKSIRAITKHPDEFSFVTAAADNIKKWQSKDGRFIHNFKGHNSVLNTAACNQDGVLITGADDGTMKFWDYKTGYNFQSTRATAQPGSLDAENGIYCSTFDVTGTRYITGEADKTIKIWKEDDDAVEEEHPVDMKAWRKVCIDEARGRY